MEAGFGNKGGGGNSNLLYGSIEMSCRKRGGRCAFLDHREKSHRGRGFLV